MRYSFAYYVMLGDEVVAIFQTKTDAVRRSLEVNGRWFKARY